METQAAVIYCRISQDRTGEQLGVERQLQLCREMAARLKLGIVAEYIDNDLSATTGRVRPRFEAMLAARPGAIVTWHQDRLLRLTRDLERVIDLDVPVYTVTAGNIDLSTPTGRAVARTVAAWSTYEGEQKATRQRAANRQRAERGHWHFSRRPFGYIRRNGRVEVVPDEAATVREAFARYIRGDSYYAIAEDFNARTIATATGTKWTMTTVRAMLRNPRYAGISEYLGERIEPDEVKWEPLIDERTWANASKVRSGRRSAGTWSRQTKHLLSGLIRCGVCDARMLARPDHGVQKYACSANWCTSRVASKVDEMVKAFVLARLADPLVVARLTAAPDAAPLERERASLVARRSDLIDLIADGLLGGADARARASELAQQIATLDRRIDALRENSPLTDLALSESIPVRWESLSVQARRRVISDLGLVIHVDRAASGRRPFDPSAVRIEVAESD